MKKLFIVAVMTLMGLCLLTCKQKPKQENKDQEDKGNVEVTKIDSSKIGKPIILEKDIMKDFNSFWSYYTGDIKFFEDFVPFDTAGLKMEKGDFLKVLSSGNYYPLIIYSKDSLINYKLAKIPAKAPEYAGAYISQDSRAALVHYKMEGKAIPAFSFTDVNGKLYTSANTRGKIVLFKCWFINCPVCIQEMPELNRMVQKYKDRNDILFISLARDPKKPLQTFLKKTQFDYATVPNQDKYMSEQLKVSSYPHHFLINKDGLMVKAVEGAADIEMLLARELVK